MPQNQTITRLNQMRLLGIARAYELLLTTRNAETMTNDEMLNYLIDAEWEDRENRKLKRLITNAKFRYQADVEEVSFDNDRNLDKNTFMRLSNCEFIEKKENIIITGATGVGKSHLASAIGNQACIKGYKTVYFNTAKLMSSLKMKRADGTYIKEIERIEKQNLIILDDFGIMQLDTQARLDLLEIIEDRYNRNSTIITSQIPIDKWHNAIDDSTIADAVLDRLVHNSHRIELKGQSMRRKIKTKNQK